MTGQIFVIAGTSGSGKTTIGDALLKRHSNLSKPVAVTTRAPRLGEIFGVHYYFVDGQIFSWLLHTDQLLEHTQKYGSNGYGTLLICVQQLLNQGRDVILEIDIQGAEKITKLFPNTKTIFLRTADENIQRQRLIKRGTTGQELEARMNGAPDELAGAEQASLPIIINNNVATTVCEVEAIFFTEPVAMV